MAADPRNPPADDEADSHDQDASGAPARAKPAEKSHDALYLQLADTLREKIYSKEWGVRTRIPSEHELMEQYDVARGTVRRALKILVDEGLLVQEQGRGTFVAEPGISHPAGVRPLSFAKSLHDQGREFETHVVEKTLEPAPVDVARELEIRPEDEVMFVRRVRTVADEPVMCQESWLAYEVLPGIFDMDLTSISLFDAVEACSGGKIRYSYMRYSARIAGKEHGELLGCDEAAAVLLLEQLIRLEDGRPIEWSTAWFPPGQSVVGNAVQQG